MWPNHSPPTPGPPPPPSSASGGACGVVQFPQAAVWHWLVPSGPLAHPLMAEIAHGGYLAAGQPGGQSLTSRLPSSRRREWARQRCCQRVILGGCAQIEAAGVTPLPHDGKREGGGLPTEHLRACPPPGPMGGGLRWWSVRDASWMWTGFWGGVGAHRPLLVSLPGDPLRRSSFARAPPAPSAVAVTGPGGCHTPPRFGGAIP